VDIATPNNESNGGLAMNNLIPKPVSITPTEGVFNLTASSQIYVEPGTAEITAIAQYLTGKLRPATGYELPVLETTGAPGPGNIYLTTGGDPTLGEEGYELRVSPDGVTLVAYQPAGLFRGLQTLRQLLPPSIESATLQQGSWEIGAGTIRDYPRFPWRGVMLDVVRHFFTVDQVKRYIDLIASYKMNRLHLHLSDDQGWRIVIDSWPNLATYGGSTEVGGGSGGYYTQADYAEIVAYAQSHYIMVVPEIDMPGHTNAALASYPELNCDGVARPLYTGIEVGFSSLCVDKEITYKFVEDVVREIAALTPGPYFHIGGDETAATAPEDFKYFIERVQPIVQAQGKQVVGWEEVVQAELLPTTIIQRWNTQVTQTAPKVGTKVLMSPASKTYMDMKYNPETALGMKWAAYIEVQDGYNWDPATQMAGVSEDEILGVEAPLWAETLQTMADIEFMAFPRLPGYAEIGWSPATGRAWDEYRLRLAAHGPRLTALGVNFYRSPQVPWQ
jgi:hexosaminidase